MKRKFNKKKIAGIILIVFASILIFGLVVMQLWNAILPSVIHVSSITFWQALGILALCKILFGGFKGGGGYRGRFLKHGMGSKFATMNEEEREAFKQAWRNRFRPSGTENAI